MSSDNDNSHHPPSPRQLQQGHEYQQPLPQKMKKKRPMFSSDEINIISSALSGMIAVGTFHPLELVGLRLQVQQSGNAKYKGMIHALKTIVSEEGLR